MTLISKGTQNEARFDTTLGALFIGIMVAMALWGIGTIRTFCYFNNQKFKRDRWQIRSLVGITWLLDLSHQILIIHAGYAYLLRGALYRLTIEWSIAYSVLVTGIVCLLVQSFLIYRIWKLSQKNVYVASTLAAIVLAAFCFSTVYLVRSLQMNLMAKVVENQWIGIVGNGLSVVSDIAVASTLIFYFHRAQTNLKRSDTMIMRLITYTLATGLSTSFAAGLALLFLALYPMNFIYSACHLSISKLYLNSLVTNLNIRSVFEGQNKDTDVSESIAFSTAFYAEKAESEASVLEAGLPNEV